MEKRIELREGDESGNEEKGESREEIQERS